MGKRKLTLKSTNRSTQTIHSGMQFSYSSNRLRREPDQRNIYRLLQLFPRDKSVSIIRMYLRCNKDIMRTIDNILYTKRYAYFRILRDNRDSAVCRMPTCRYYTRLDCPNVLNELDKLVTDLQQNTQVTPNSCDYLSGSACNNLSNVSSNTAAGDYSNNFVPSCNLSCVSQETYNTTAPFYGMSTTNVNQSGIVTQAPSVAGCSSNGLHQLAYGTNTQVQATSTPYHSVDYQVEATNTPYHSVNYQVQATSTPYHSGTSETQTFDGLSPIPNTNFIYCGNQLYCNGYPQQNYNSK